MSAVPPIGPGSVGGVVLIRPSHGWADLQLRELFAHHELVYFLAWREIKVRYKQTLIGAVWAILQPLLSMLVFTLFFGRLAGMPSDGVPYSAFALAALVPWTFFANSLAQASNSLVANAGLVTKVYFPRLTIPLASVCAGVVDLALGLLLLVTYVSILGFGPSPRVLFVPLFILLALSAALGAGLWFSALNVEFRDVRYAVPFLLQLWLFATPVVYPSSLLGEPWRTVYSLNPMVGVVEGFRWALLGTASLSPSIVFTSASAGAFLLVTGAFFFRRMERRFADVI